MNIDARIKILEDKIADLEIAIDYSDDGLHLLDRNGVTILINLFCQENEGLIFEEIQGKSMQMLEREGILSDSVTMKVLEKKKTVTMIQHVKSGKDMLVTGTPIFDDVGEIYRVMVNSRDITELNRLKNELVKTQFLYNETKHKLLELNGMTNIPKYIVCKSEAMKKILQRAMMVSAVDSNVLITGESGTGKGVISRFIHDQSNRREKPYVKIDCSSIPETLFESELFGYGSGAFTGANQKGKIGLMELADGGTFFLDEIGELPFRCQAKLLRAIQDKEFIPVGGDRVRKVNVRIISATNRNLQQMVEDGTFREDLYYRINVVPIMLPSLRSRQEDIPDLIHMFVQRLCGQYGFERRFNMDAIDTLMECEWKGNIRELENLVEMVVIISGKSLIGVGDLPPSVYHKKGVKNLMDQENLSLEERLMAYEKLILGDMVAKGKKPAEMAKELNVDVTTIRRKLQRFRVSP